MDAYYPLWENGKPVGRMTQEFGVYNPRYIKYGFSYHNGYDIAIAAGFPISAHEGFVDRILTDSTGYGKLVQIKTNYGWLRYAHLQSVSVKPSSYLNRGDILGKVNSTGDSTGNHLHFEFEPFNSDKNNGTLGRVDFNFIYHKNNEEEEFMSVGQAEWSSAVLWDRRRQNKANGWWTKKSGQKGMFDHFDERDNLLQTFPNEQNLIDNGYKKSDVGNKNWKID